MIVWGDSGEDERDFNDEGEQDAINEAHDIFKNLLQIMQIEKCTFLEAMEHYLDVHDI